MRRLHVALLLSLLALLGATVARAQTPPPPDIIVEALHIFITRVGDHLTIVEDYIISNQGAETYAGVPGADGAQTTLTFTLPSEASALTFDGPGLGERYVGDAQRFADTQPIPPGSTTAYVSFSYEIPDREGLTLTRSMDVQITGVVIILRDERLTLAGEQITPMGMLETQNGPAQGYAARPLAAGEPLTLTFILAAEPKPAERNLIAESGLGLVALSLGLGIAYKVWNTPARSPSRDKAPSAPPEALRAQVQAIAALDADFANGALEEADYKRQRAQLKQTLREALSGEKTT